MTSAARRIDVHHHIIPPFYRDLLTQAGIDEASGRALPDWSPGAALELMNLLGTATAIVSVSTPGTGFLTDPGEAADLARRHRPHPEAGSARRFLASGPATG